MDIMKLDKELEKFNDPRAFLYPISAFGSYRGTKIPYDARVIARRLMTAETADLREDVSEKIMDYFKDHKKAEYVVLRHWLYFSNAGAKKAITYQLINDFAGSVDKDKEHLSLVALNEEGVYAVNYPPADDDDTNAQSEVDKLLYELKDNISKICSKTKLKGNVVILPKNKNYGKYGTGEYFQYCKIKVELAL